MGEHNILDEVGVMGGNQILDEVGEWGEVDIVEDEIEKQNATKSVKGEKVKWEKIQCFGKALTVNGQSRRIHADSPPLPGANELKPCPL